MGDVSKLLELTDPVHLITEKKKSCVSYKTLLLLPDMVKDVLRFHIDHVRPLLVRKGQAATSSASPVVAQTDLAHAGKLLELSDEVFQQRLFRELASLQHSENVHGLDLMEFQQSKMTKLECIVAYLQPPGGWKTRLLTAKQVSVCTYTHNDIQRHAHLIFQHTIIIMIRAIYITITLCVSTDSCSQVSTNLRKTTIFS